MQANLRHIQAFEAKPNPRPLPDTAVTRGFEKVAFPKLVRELRDPSPVVRQKSLLAARELLAAPVNHVQCVAAGATPAIVDLLQDEDDVTRYYAAGTLRCLVAKEVGARDLIQHRGVEALVAALEDPSEPVRDDSYAALIEAARFDSMRRALEALGGALPRVMQLVLLEAQAGAAGRAQQGLALLFACTQARHNAGVLTQLLEAASAVPYLARLLAPQLPEGVRHAAAELLCALASREDAKLQAVQEGCVPLLLQAAGLLRVAFSTSAVAALGAITVSRAGKYAVVEAAGGLQRLVGVLEPSNEQLCINAMVAIANVAEAPEAREVLAGCGAAAKLTAIFEGAASEPLKRSAAHAIRQCGFKHLPYGLLPGAPPLPEASEGQ